MLTRVSALELAPFNIRVIAIAPGHTITRMNFGDDWADQSAAAPTLPIAPLGRSARPEEIAAFIAFLAHAEHGYLTGSTITVDGGLLLASGPNTLQQHTGLPPIPA